MKQLVFLIIIGVISVLALNSCTDETEAQRILSANGYTNIEFTGRAWFACAESDTYATGFKAKGPTGQSIEGAVCSGLFWKNSTIRFN